jgi:anaerobic selenocysteine-containing dehydrogenase
MEQNTLTRRSFVKASALLGACAALSVGATSSLVETDEAFAADTGSERTMYRTICHSCIQGCPCRVYVENGVIVKLEGDPAAPVSKGAMCLKGQSQLHTLYSPQHVLYPMKRVGERGAANASWERISWDEAIDTASDQIISMLEKYGPYGIWMGTGGGGQYVSPQGQVIPKAFGAPIQLSGGALQCYGPRRLAAALMLGGDGSNLSMADSAIVEPFNEFNPTMEVLVIWGASPSISQTAQSGRGLADARVDRGLKTIVIDPFMIPDATKADVWLPVRPGSDTALILSWVRYIFENKLYNEEFCKYWTNLPFLINPNTGLPYLAEEVWPDYVNPVQDPAGKFDTPAYVCFDAKTNSIQPFPYTAPADSPVDPVIITTATVNGAEAKTGGQIYWEEAEPWTLEHTAEICWLQADKIEEAVKLYATAEHAGIAEGVFADMMELSTHVPIGLMALEMIMGNVFKPGCTLTGHGAPPKTRPTCGFNHNARWGIGWTYGWTKEENERAIAKKKEAFVELGKDPEEMSQGAFKLLSERYASDKYRGAYFMDMTHNGSIRVAAETGEPYKVRVLLEVSGNKLCTVSNTDGWFNSYNQQDYIMQQYTNMTSFTVEHADLFLPIQEWAEYNSAENLINQNNVNFLRRAVVHLGETVAPERPYMAVAERVAEKIGEDAFFDFNYLKTGNTRVLYDDPAAKKQAWAEYYGASSWQDLLDNQDEYVPKITPPEDYWVYNQYLGIVDDGLPAGFGTESRKCQVYCYPLLQIGRTGFPLLYPYELPDVGLDYTPICKYHEQQENPLDDKEYPLVFTSGRVMHTHHGTLRHAAFNRELMPVADCYINPKTAAEYGIEHHDWVKLTSRRGSGHGRAYLTEGIAPGVVRQERWWNPECYDSSVPKEQRTGGWRECGISSLTRDDTANECIGSASYRAFTVKLEKATKPAGIWTDPKDFAPFLPTQQNEPQTEEVVF